MGVKQAPKGDASFLVKSRVTRLGEFLTFWRFFNLEQFVLNIASLLNRKGNVFNLTKGGLGYILGDFRRPLGDFSQKHLVTLVTKVLRFQANVSEKTLVRGSQ
jgi:hypothetical protein